MKLKRVLLSLIVLASATSSFAQSRNNRQVAPPPDRDSIQSPTESDMGVNLPDEMRIRMLIARRENEYKKVMESVDQLNDLSEQVATRFRRDGRLVETDLKLMGQIEKLARQVLSHAGGETVQEKEDKKPTVGEAVDLIAAEAAKIKRDMTAETRFVVSAAVIASSNQVINLSRYVRRVRN
jgi:hypothetical protein